MTTSTFENITADPLTLATFVSCKMREAEDVILSALAVYGIDWDYNRQSDEDRLLAILSELGVER